MNLRLPRSSQVKLKKKQDDFCSKAEAGHFRLLEELGNFPDDPQWEALVDVLRGRVKDNTHCHRCLRSYLEFSTNSNLLSIDAFNNSWSVLLL
ncbi:hypothetical protein F5879DRAFT_144199 [Lentinula edodes]|nr:hypothetical protein F5879DRAFT_144199 [Lentinula edodes]